MFMKYFYDEKLAHASYLVGCQAKGVAIVIDPSRDIHSYLDAAGANGLSITAVAETHIHADYISGSMELASKTGAMLYLSDEGDADWKYLIADQIDSQLLKDGDRFSIGNLTFEVLHTPGHTPEHVSFLLTDGGAAVHAPIGLFTGDFIFAGDVGRPDLLERAAGVKGSAYSLAKKMFKSLQRFKQLPDYLQVWPAHGAGSACGKSLGAVPSSTVGYEKLANWALQYEEEDLFIEALLSGQPEAPKYFGIMKRLNKQGTTLIENLEPVHHTQPSLTLVQEWIQNGIVVDTRQALQFAKKHIAGTMNLPCNQSFVTWAGWLLDYDQPIYLMVSKEKEAETLKALQSIGLDQVKAVMDHSFIEQLELNGMDVVDYQSVEPKEIMERLDEYYVLDVRRNSEWRAGHIPEAHHIMLGHLKDRMNEIPSEKPILINCKSGARSAIAISILKANGFDQVLNLAGGFDQWLKESSIKLVNKIH
ncbi:MBL fold metallo-hydrolase [Neobacillus cucumis]|uniref:MBL fold metallo-hydrolase n=1 Tax=Neobacillus cucumis TaxID=1740721 RepID=UPI0018DFCC30|nr:MBL fold metallo-hydrolase [Neobacillus cucumis]MBI0579929.1 MBL fold metallo-hydrolase [Neobacillus cucumis]